MGAILDIQTSMQVAIYKGSIPDSKHAYQLDDHHRFEKGRPQLVCGNTAAMVRGARHFVCMKGSNMIGEQRKSTRSNE